MNCKKLNKKISIYFDGEQHDYITIFNKGNCYIKALFINDSFECFCIFEALIDSDLNHILPEEVVTADSLETAQIEWNEITYNYYTQN